MSAAPSPLAAYDIWADGRTEPAPDCALTGPGLYRWLHFDLNDPALPGWSREVLPPLAAASLLEPETRPRCDEYDDGLIINLRGVNLNLEGPVDRMVTLRLWVEPGALVTVRNRRVFAVEDIRTACSEGRAPGSMGLFLARLIEGLAVRARDVALDLETEVEKLEEAEEEDDLPSADLRATRRKIIRLRRYLTPQLFALEELDRSKTQLLTEDDHENLREGINVTALATEALEAQSARLQSLQDYVDTRIALRQGRNGYVLSLVAAVFLPLGFLTGLFGVNVAGMPGTGSPGAFAVLCLALVAIGALSVIVLRWLRLR